MSVDNLIPRVSTESQWLWAYCRGRDPGYRRTNSCFTVQIRHSSPNNQPFHPGRLVNKPRQLGPILPRADDRRALGTSPRRDRLNILSSKRVMVTKPEIARDASSMCRRIGNERLRTRERRRHHQVRAIKRCERHVPTTSAKALHAQPRMTRPRHGRRAMQTLDLRCKDGINTRCARHNHHAGSTQRARWLAEPTRRQQRAVDRGSSGIHQHNV